MITEQDIWTALSHVPDPEIPVLNVLDLGIVRQVQVNEGAVMVSITPTYSGCPATDTIAADIKTALVNLGVDNPDVQTQLRPAWTTDWISTEGREKLLAYGIVPPVEPVTDTAVLFGEKPIIACPRCKSEDTMLVSQFGSTPCKAQYKCNECLEPFDYFKCLR